MASKIIRTGLRVTLMPPMTIARITSSRTIAYMTTLHQSRTTTPPQTAASIEVLLALPKVERIELLRALHTGQPGPRVIVTASVLVKSLRLVGLDQGI